MDEKNLSLLGFKCQSKKPEVCGSCSVKLIKGINWYTTRRHFVCKSCDNLRSTKWAVNNPEKAKERYERNSKTFTTKYNVGKKCARLRNVVWSITKEQFKLLISNPCHYCGHELPKAGVGLDQIVPSNGYTTDNVVPCCTQCNQAKNSYFTYEEMLLIGKIIKDIKDKRKLSNLQENT